MSRTIEIDPFVEEFQSGNPDDGMIGRGYVDASTMRLRSGRSAAEVMGAGPGGVRAVVIPRATLGGVPAGRNPHDLTNVEMHIDPFVPGQSSIVRVGDLSAAMVAANANVSRQAAPNQTSMAQMRYGASAVMHELARATTGIAPSHMVVDPKVDIDRVGDTNMAANRQPVAPRRARTLNVIGTTPSAPQRQSVVEPASVPQPVASAPGSPMRPKVAQATTPVRKLAPLLALDQQAPTAPVRTRTIDISDTYVPQGPPEPTVNVEFSVQGLGTIQTAYHDMVVVPGTADEAGNVAGGFIVLVYHSDFKGQKFFPPAEGAPQIAINKIGEREVYGVRASGYNWVRGNEEHMILLIDRFGLLPGSDTPE